MDRLSVSRIVVALVVGSSLGLPYAAPALCEQSQSDGMAEMRGGAALTGALVPGSGCPPAACAPCAVAPLGPAMALTGTVPDAPELSVTLPHDAAHHPDRSGAPPTPPPLS